MKTLFPPPPRPPLPPLQRWTLELVGRDAQVPAIIRLRKFLKMAGRSYNLRCTRITGQTGEQVPETLEQTALAARSCTASPLDDVLAVENKGLNQT